MSVLEVSDLAVHLRTNRGIGRAVDGVNLTVAHGETLGLVGESGSGKSLTALTIAGLQPRPVAQVVAGRIELNGRDLLRLKEREMRRVRGSEVSMVLQDPLTALNPIMTVGSQIRESLRLHQQMTAKQRRDRAVELMTLLQIRDAAHRLRAYPHQLSGGMCQRVVGAIALACSPDLLIADEPTTALDVTAQAAYLALLKQIQNERGLAILFITHDFGVVSKLCDRVAVMYAGEIVESGQVVDVLAWPRHPYTQAMIRSVPDVRRASQKLVSIPGRPPAPTDLPTGCRFHPRCWLYEQLGRPEACRVSAPGESRVSASATVRCHFPAEALAASQERRIPVGSHDG